MSYRMIFILIFTKAVSSSIFHVDAFDVLPTTPMAGCLAITFDLAALAFIAFLNCQSSAPQCITTHFEQGTYHARAMYLRRFFRGRSSTGCSSCSSIERGCSPLGVVDGSRLSILANSGRSEDYRDSRGKERVTSIRRSGTWEEAQKVRGIPRAPDFQAEQLVGGARARVRIHPKYEIPWILKLGGRYGEYFNLGKSCQSSKRWQWQ